MAGERKFRKLVVVVLFLAPSLVPLLAFRVYPMLSALWISTLDWNLIRPPKNVGLANYAYVLGSSDFHRALGHTLYYTALYLPLVLVGSLVVALLLNTKVRGLRAFRAIYFLPVVTSWVVVALLWKWILSPNGGLVNYLLGLLGVQGPGWWADMGWAMPSIVLASVWKDLGFTMLVLLAGLQNIPEEIYEAAKLDGATTWQRIRKITLPLLSPSILFVVVLGLIGAFQVFDQVYVMTEGGPAGATTVVMQQVVSYAFSYGRMGEASAMSWILFLIIFVFTLAQLRLQRRWVHYAD